MVERTPSTAASSDEYADEEQPEVRFHLINWNGAIRGNLLEKFWVGVKPGYPIDTT
jgi:hypothetical protein